MLCIDWCGTWSVWPPYMRSTRAAERLGLWQVILECLCWWSRWRCVQLWVLFEMRLLILLPRLECSGGIRTRCLPGSRLFPGTLCCGVMVCVWYGGDSHVSACCWACPFDFHQTGDWQSCIAGALGVAVWPLQYAVTLPLQQLPDAPLFPPFIRCLRSLLASFVLMSFSWPAILHEVCFAVTDTVCASLSDVFPT
jgi:hypothetical protein